jgi:hypothetical protein
MRNHEEREDESDTEDAEVNHLIVLFQIWRIYMNEDEDDNYEEERGDIMISEE